MGLLDTLRARLIGANNQPPARPAAKGYYTNSLLTGLGGGFTGENHDLSLSDEGAAIAHTVNIAAYRAIDARMRAVGSMPWRIIDDWSGEEFTSSEDSRPSHLFGVALRRSADELGQPLFALWEMGMCITGKAFIEPYKNSVGFYAGLDWLNPTRVTILHNGGVITGYQYYGDGKAETYTPDELTYERFPNLLSDIYGLSPLHVALSRVNININTDRFLSAFYRNNSRFGMVISPTAEDGFSEFEINQIKAQIESAKGSDRAWRSFITPHAVNVSTFDNPDLSKYVEMYDRVETAIYTAFGVPRPVAGDVDTQSYQARDEINAMFYQNTVVPRCRDIEQVVNNELLPLFDKTRKARFEFDVSEWERISPTRQAQIEMVNHAYDTGALTLNERRQLLNKYVSGLDIDEWATGNVILLNGVHVQIADIGKVQAAESYATLENSNTPDDTAPDSDTEPPALSPQPAAPEVNTLAQQQDALAELRTWRKYAKKHGAAKALTFDTMHLADWQVLRLKHALKDSLYVDSKLLVCGFNGMEESMTGHDLLFPDQRVDYSQYTLDYIDCLKSVTDDPSVITEASNRHALSILAQKAIQATRSDYETTVEDMLTEAIAGNVDRRRAGNILRGATQLAIGKAYLDGLEDGGITEPELDASDQEWIADWFDQQRVYINSLMDAIYKDDRVTPDEVEGKAAMWYVKSIQPAYYEGLASASKNGSFEWVLGDREKHCPSCVKLNGQVRRISYWNNTVKPGDSRLACNGFNCGCDLVPTRKPLSRGRLPSWQRSIHMH